MRFCIIYDAIRFHFVFSILLFPYLSPFRIPQELKFGLLLYHEKVSKYAAATYKILHKHVLLGKRKFIIRMNFKRVIINHLQSSSWNISGTLASGEQVLKSSERDHSQQSWGCFAALWYFHPCSLSSLSVLSLSGLYLVHKERNTKVSKRNAYF